MTEQTNPEQLPDEELPSPRGEGDIDIEHVKRVLEAALLSAAEPLTVQQLKRLFGAAGCLTLKVPGSSRPAENVLDERFVIHDCHAGSHNFGY